MSVWALWSLPPAHWESEPCEALMDFEFSLMRLRQPRLGETRLHGCATHCSLNFEKGISFCWVPTSASWFLLPQHGLVLRHWGDPFFVASFETAWSRSYFLLPDTSMLGRWTGDRTRSGADLSGTASRQNTENIEKQFAFIQAEQKEPLRTIPWPHQ